MQNGTQPAFGYPIMDYGSRTYELTNHLLDYPEDLAAKYRRNIKDDTRLLDLEAAFSQLSA